MGRMLREVVEQRMVWANRQIGLIRVLTIAVGFVSYPWTVGHLWSRSTARAFLFLSVAYAVAAWGVATLTRRHVLVWTLLLMAGDLGVTLAGTMITGGTSSPLIPLIALVIYSFSYRCPPRQTMVAALVAVTGYAVLAYAQAGDPLVVSLHVIFFGLSGALAAMMSRESLVQRLERGALEHALRQLSESEARLREAAETRNRLDHEREARQSAERAVDVRDEFLAVATHELKTPLTSIQLDLELLRHDLASAAPELGLVLERRLSRLDRQSSRLVRLIDDLLDVSRLAGGTLNLRREPVELGSLIQEVVGRAKEPLARAGVEVIISAEQAIVGRWDAMRVEQVVDNLLSNAMKYAPGRPVEIIASRRGDRAIFKVCDQGPGIALAEQARIFERYERATTEDEGLGLGLWIVRQLVEAMGGTILVESELGAGATFIVTLPTGVTELSPLERDRAPAP